MKGQSPSASTRHARRSNRSRPGPSRRPATAFAIESAAPRAGLGMLAAMLRCSVVILAIWLVFPQVPAILGRLGDAHAQAEAADELAADQLSARVLALLATQPAPPARGPLEQAKLALAQASAARANQAH